MINPDEAHVAYQEFRKNFEDFDMDGNGPALVICLRCGAAVHEYYTDTHMEWHEVTA